MPDSDSLPIDRPSAERNSTVTWIGVLVIATGFLLWLTFFRPRHDSNAATQHPGVGTALTALRLEPLTGDGAPITRESVQGKVALINFWGTWCPPCIREFPYLAALEKGLRPRGDFMFLSVSCGAGGDELGNLDELRAETQQFIEQQRATHPTYFDPASMTRQALSSRSIFNVYPTTIIVDRAGVIRGVWEGYRSGVDQEMAALIATLLDKQ